LADFGSGGKARQAVEDVWIGPGPREIDKAKKTIDAVPKKHPFELRYHTVEKVDWETCARVLDAEERKRFLSQAW
jgi:hypothetical protein